MNDAEACFSPPAVVVGDVLWRPRFLRPLRSFLPGPMGRSAALLAMMLAGPCGLAADPPGLREQIDKGREALAGMTGGLNASAFADWATWRDEEGRRRFGFGAGELDLALRLGDWGETSGAWVGTREEQHWTVWFKDWHPFGGGAIAPRGSLWVGRGFHIQAGRFDVPFGADYPYFASKDSISIERPLTTALIMKGGYNDRGLRLLGNNGTLNFNAYILRGFGDGRLFGGRLGFTPFGRPFSLKESRDPKALEVGLSAFIQRTPGGRQTQRAFAVDLEANVGAFSMLAEYLGRQRRPEDGPALWQRGWHLTPQWAFRGGVPTRAFLRFEKVWGATPDAQDPVAAGEPTVRIGAGFSLRLLGMVQAKVECQRSLRVSPVLGADPAFARNRVLVQLVVVL